jgi:hypothetical protein
LTDRSDEAALFDQDLGTRFLVTLMVIVIAIFSVFVFFTGGLYSALDMSLSRELLRLGLHFSMGAVLVAILLLVIGVSVLSVGRLRAVLHLSTALFIPSGLFFSNVDPFHILGFPNDFSDLGSTLPDIVVLLNGALIVCGHVFLRSYRQALALRSNLIGRGASPVEVMAATRASLSFTLLILSVAIALAMIVQVLFDLLSGTALEIDLLPVAAVVAVLSLLLILSFLLQIRPVEVREEG